MKRLANWVSNNRHLTIVATFVLSLGLALAASAAFAQVTLTINGQPVTQGTVSVVTGTTPVPPVCTGGQFWSGTACICLPGQTWSGSQCLNPPPPPVITGYTLLAPQAITWPRGNAYNVVGAPLISQGDHTIRPWVISFNALLPAVEGNISLYENSSNLKVNISAAAGDMGPQGGVNPYFLAVSGKDGIKFVGNSNPNTDDFLGRYGYKRLPLLSETAYINVQADGPATYYLLYN